MARIGAIFELAFVSALEVKVRGTSGGKFRLCHGLDDDVDNRVKNPSLLPCTVAS